MRPPVLPGSLFGSGSLVEAPFFSADIVNVLLPYEAAFYRLQLSSITGGSHIYAYRFYTSEERY